MRVQTEGTGNAEVRGIRSGVLFDPSDGTILHVHTVVTMEGAAETSDEELKRRTLTLASDRGIEAQSVDLLYVDPTELEAHPRYRVNPDTRSLEVVRQPGIPPDLLV